MGKTYTDADLKRILGANRADSPIIDQKMQEAYAEIRKRGNKSNIRKINVIEEKDVQTQGSGRYSTKTSSVWKKAGGGFGAAAAVFILAIIFCAANPSLASEIPVLGSIFSKMQGIFTFGGIPEDEITYLQEEQTAGAGGAEGMGNVSGTSIGQMMQEQSIGAGELWESSETPDNTSMSRYQATDRGLTVTLTEYYASNQAIFIGVKVESEEAFPEMANFSNYQLLQLYTTETYSFRDVGNEEITYFRDLEGQLEDENTFVGVMRIDYDSIRMDYRKYDAAVAEADAKGEPYPEINDDTYADWIREYEIPDSFQMQLQIDGFRIYPYQQETGVEPYKVKGTWTILDTLDIRQSSTNSAVIRIDETNEEGIGLEYIELSPVELTLHMLQNGDRLTFAVVFDKDGRRIRHGGTNAYDLAIYGHDISVITIYVCDYDEYMDELKGIGLQQGDAVFQEVLEERSLYKKTIDTTQYLQD